MKPGPRPFVFLNVAMTADGKIATENHAVSSFGSARDLEHLYELRATADAVMSGARTVELDNVTMGPGGTRFEAQRVRRGLARFNIRVIVSGSGTIDLTAPIFRHRFSPIIVITSERAPARRRRRLQALADEVLVIGHPEIDLAGALAHLRRRWKIRRLLSEGGGELNAALFRAGLVDEVHATICPKIFGGRTATTLAEGKGSGSLEAATPMKVKRTRLVGRELFVVYDVVPQLNSATS